MLEIMPYNFVSLGKGKARVAPHDPYAKDNLEGRMTCLLTVRTPLFIPNTSGGGRAQRVFYSYEDLAGKKEWELRAPKEPVVPGSSIRGMLRAAYEAASNSCMGVLKKENNDASRQALYALAEGADYLPCSGKGNNLCPACSLFGMVGAGYGGRAYGSRIRFTDAQCRGKIEYGEPRQIPQLWEPRAYAAGFYTRRHENGAETTLRGRKFYWHHEVKPEGINTERTMSIWPVVKGVFSFELYFDGITEAELRQLAALIQLKGQNGYRGAYKLGTAKPLGYGSVALDIEAVTVRKIELSGDGIAYINEDITDQLKDITLEEAFGAREGALDELMSILDPQAIQTDGVTVKYPEPESGFRLHTIPEIVKQAASLRKEEAEAKEAEARQAEAYAAEQLQPPDEDFVAAWAMRNSRFNRGSDRDTSKKPKIKSAKQRVRSAMK